MLFYLTNLSAQKALTGSLARHNGFLYPRTAISHADNECRKYAPSCHIFDSDPTHKLPTNWSFFSRSETEADGSSIFLLGVEIEYDYLFTVVPRDCSSMKNPSAINVDSQRFFVVIVL